MSKSLQSLGLFKTLTQIFIRTDKAKKLRFLVAIMQIKIALSTLRALKRNQNGRSSKCKTVTDKSQYTLTMQRQRQSSFDNVCKDK